MDLGGIEPPSSTCKAAVLPLILQAQLNPEGLEPSSLLFKIINSNILPLNYGLSYNKLNFN